MFDIAPTELLLVAVVALLVIGPKDLPKAMRMVGKWAGRARGVARQFRSGLDTMMRESELAELEKQWAADNERIMRENPPASLPAPQAHMSGGPGIPAEPAGEIVDQEGEDAGPVMTAQPDLKPEPAPALETVDRAPEVPPPAPPRKPRARKPRKAPAK